MSVEKKSQLLVVEKENINFVKPASIIVGASVALFLPELSHAGIIDGPLKDMVDGLSFSDIKSALGAYYKEAAGIGLFVTAAGMLVHKLGWRG